MNSQDLTGQTLDNKYLLKKLLGEGGMGVVYEGEHIAIGKRVAIKLLHAFFVKNEEVLKRFSREARAAAAISHRNIIDVQDVGVTQSDEPYLVMEFLEGEGLAELLERKRILPLHTACAILEPTLIGLQAAHEKEIVHRDLKPDNIYIARYSGQPLEIKLIDFGISKFQDSNPKETKLTMQGTTLGTPAYMSPEQAKGADNVNHLTDVYAVGIILYEMLAGDTPYVGRSYPELLANILTNEPRHPQTVHNSFPMQAWPVIQRAIDKDPKKRFANANEMLQAIRALGTKEERAAYLEALEPDLGAAIPHAAQPEPTPDDAVTVQPTANTMVAREPMEPVIEDAKTAYSMDVSANTLLVQDDSLSRTSEVLHENLESPDQVVAPASDTAKFIVAVDTVKYKLTKDPRKRFYQLGSGVGMLLILALLVGPCMSQNTEVDTKAKTAAASKKKKKKKKAKKRKSKKTVSKKSAKTEKPSSKKTGNSQKKANEKMKPKNASEGNGAAKDTKKSGKKGTKNPFKRLGRRMKRAFN